MSLQSSGYGHAHAQLQQARTYIITKRFDLEEIRLTDSPMDAGFEVVESDFDAPPTEEMILLYHSMIVSIGYPATTVRFDVRYGLSVLSRFWRNRMTSSSMLPRES